MNNKEYCNLKSGEFMKQLLRTTIGLFLTIPFWVFIKVLSFLISKQKAINFLGPVATIEGKILGKIFIVPR